MRVLKNGQNHEFFDKNGLAPMKIHNTMKNVLGNTAPSKTIIVCMWVFKFKCGHTKDDPRVDTLKVQHSKSTKVIHTKSLP